MPHAVSRAPQLAAALLLLTASTAIAREEIQVKRVEFERGASSAIVEDSITGYEITDYVLGVRKGQAMTVSMATDNTANYFNILAPGEDQVALFNGSIGENQYEGILPETGDYKIRVYLMRSAARRNEVARYRLEMIIAEATVPSPGSGDGDALVPGTGFHAVGELFCAMGAGQPTGSCRFGVVRRGGGSGTVKVTKPDGRTRSIFFENGVATGSDASEADPGALRTAREGDLSIVRIGAERYEIPDAVLFGG